MVNVAAAKALPELIALAANGEVVILARAGKPRAKIVGLGPPTAKLRSSPFLAKRSALLEAQGAQHHALLAQDRAGRPRSVVPSLLQSFTRGLRGSDYYALPRMACAKTGAGMFGASFVLG